MQYSLVLVDVKDSAGTGLLSGVTAIAGGNLHTCALTSSGGVKCWGFNNYGQLGDGTTTTPETLPVDVKDSSGSANLSGATAIVLGDSHTCALTSNGGAKCWGRSVFGQVGDNTNAVRLTPVDVLIDDTAPTIGGVTLGLAPTGTPTWNMGETLMGNYTYSDVDGDVETGTTFQWYQATDNSCSTGKTVIAGATARTYTPVSSDVGKYLCLGVTPANIQGIGTEILVTSGNTIIGSQAITFTELPASVSVEIGSLTLSATGGASGNPVTFASTTPSVCTVSGTTLTIVSAGTCTVIASQAGDANYNAATVSKNITIAEKNTTVSVPTPPLPDQLGLIIQIDGSGEGKVTSDTGLFCQSSDCQVNEAGDLKCQPAACNQLVKTTSTVTLTPQADAGSVFSSWGGNEDCVDGQVFMNGSKLCIAFFRRIYPLTVTLNGQGQVTGLGADQQLMGIDCGNKCEASYSSGTTVYLQATPATGLNFLGWGGQCEGMRNPLAVTVSQEMTCEARFGTLESPPVVVIPEPVVPLVPAEASTPTGEASTAAVPLVPAEASTSTGEVSTPAVSLVPAEASTPTGEVSTPAVSLVPAEASTSTGEVSTPAVSLVPAEASLPLS